METIEDKYGLPVTCRVPAIIKKELANEAQERGLSFAAYLSIFVVSSHQKSSSHQAELRAVYKEKEALQSKYLTLQNATNWYKDEHREKVDILLKNERILHSLYEKYGEGIIEKKMVEEAGFNLAYATDTISDDDNAIRWVCVFSIYFTFLKNDKIKITKSWGN